MTAKESHEADIMKFMTEMQPQQQMTCKKGENSWFVQTHHHSLSFVGSVFFSWVSVFFSFPLSNEVTSDTSGLSPMAI